MDFWTAMDNFPVLHLRLTVIAREMLNLPAQNKGNTLRGAFGTEFRRLACVSECRGARECPLDAPLAGPESGDDRDEDASREACATGASPARATHACPYREIFEPAPPKWAGRLSKNQDAPRPFVFRPPLTDQTTWRPGESFDFELLLFGRAVQALPWFVLSFRTVLEGGFGLNRAKCELGPVSSLHPGGSAQSIYDPADPVLREAAPQPISQWIRPRVQELERDLADQPDARLKIEFITPTLLKADGQPVAHPEFHHVFKRIRDRVNALSTFYGAGPIEADYAGLGSIAESARTISDETGWELRSRHSSRTGQRHELSGVSGGISVKMDASVIDHMLPWIAAGELAHVGRYTVWGHGMLSVKCMGREDLTVHSTGQFNG